MEAKNFRDWAIGIGVLIITGGLVFTVIWLLVKYLTPYTPSPGPYFSAYCEPLKDGYILTVTVDNYSGKKTLKEVKCQIVFKGEFTVVDSEEQELGDIEKGSSNSCYFLLKGDYEGPVKGLVKFNEKSTTVGGVCRQPLDEIKP